MKLFKKLMSAMLAGVLAGFSPSKIAQCFTAAV